MLFTEKDLLNAFKQNVDNKGWIYFVGNPESNAKFLIDWMKANKEEINEEGLDEYADSASESYWSDDMETFDGNSLEKEIYYVCKRAYKAGLKAGYRKAMSGYLKAIEKY